MRPRLDGFLGGVAGAVLIWLAGVLTASPAAQFPTPWVGTALPSTCGAGWLYYLTVGDAGMYYCEGTNAWVKIGPGGSSSGLPTGLVGISLTPACPAGMTPVLTLKDRMPLGVDPDTQDVGTPGGSSTITPSGTVSAPTFTGTSAQSTSAVSAGTPAGTNSVPTFTGTAWSAPGVSWPAGVPTHSGTAASFSGSALGTHQHELPLHGGTTPRITAGYGTGTSIAGTRSLTNAAQTTSQAVLLSQAISAGTPAGTVTITNQGTLAWPAGVPTLGAYTPAGTVGAPTFTGSALGTHAHTLTPAGTNSTPSFTGVQFDNRSAFLTVVFCIAS